MRDDGVVRELPMTALFSSSPIFAEVLGLRVDRTAANVCTRLMSGVRDSGVGVEGDLWYSEAGLLLRKFQYGRESQYVLSSKLILF